MFISQGLEEFMLLNLFLYRKHPCLINVIIIDYQLPTEILWFFLFNYVLLETLTSTLAMDQWAWKPEAAVSIEPSGQYLELTLTVL